MNSRKELIHRMRNIPINIRANEQAIRRATNDMRRLSIKMFGQSKGCIFENLNYDGIFLLYTYYPKTNETQVRTYKLSLKTFTCNTDY